MAVSTRSRTTPLLLIGTALFLGPVAWAIVQGAGYPMVKPVCRGLSGATLVAIFLVGASLVLCGFALASTAKPDQDVMDPTVSTPAGYTHLLAIVAIGLNALLGLLVIIAAIPHFVLSPCE